MSDSAESKKVRRLAAIVFTDVVGYSARMQVDEASTLALVQSDFEQMRRHCAQHGGQVLKSTGDGLLLCFDSVVDAVTCALAIQEGFARRSAGALQHRIGIHLGDVYHQGGDVAGDGVNLAARLQASAQPGTICVSDSVFAAVRGKVPMESAVLDPLVLKNIEHPLAAHLIAPIGRRLAVGASARGARARRGLALAAVSGAVLVGIAAIFFRRAEPTAPSPAASVASNTAPAAEFPRDPVLKRARSLIYAVDSIAEDFALADDLVKPLLSSQPNDPEIVTVAAEISAEYLTRGFDNTQPRRAQAQRLAERAVQLAPDNPAALGALGRYLRSTRTQLGRAEELLRRAITLSPREPLYYRQLYSVLIVAKPGPETEAFGARMAALFPRDPLVVYELATLHLAAGDLAAAEAGFEQTVKLAPVANAITWKAKLMLELHGDVEGMKFWLDRMPERQRTGARLANAYAVQALVTGQTAPARRLLDAVNDTWLADGTYIFPKAMLVGELDAIDGNSDAARINYQAALDEIRRTLAAEPTDLRPWRAELWVQLALGHREEALAALRVNLQRAPHPFHWNLNLTWWTSAPRGCLLLGERAQALALLKEACSEPQGRLLLRNLLQVDPKMAPFRDDPQIVALLAEPKTDTPAAPLSEGAQLAAKALALFTKVSFTRDDLASAEDFARRAIEKEPDSAAAWGVRAGVQSAWLFRGWDLSEKRLQETQTFANRALTLDPNDPEALLALGNVLRTQGAFEQAAALLRRAIAANPDRLRLQSGLAYTLYQAGREPEARTVLFEIVKRAPRDPLLRYQLALTYCAYGPGGEDPQNLANALEQLDLAFALKPFASGLILKAALVGGWRGDLPAMRAALDEHDKLSLAERSEDRSVCIAMWAGLLEHRPDRVEAAAALTARNYFEDPVMPFRPKPWSLAVAHRLAGKENLARADWQAAEALLRQRLKDDASNQNYQAELAVTLVSLGQRDEAARLIGVIEPLWREAPTFSSQRVLALYYAALGDAKQAAPYLAAVVDHGVFATRKGMPLDPWWDKLRGQPEFEAFLKEPAAKK